MIPAATSSTASTPRKTISRSPPRASIPAAATSRFLDGSVRFIKESINTWPYNPANGAPTNVSYNSSTGLFTAGPPMGVYQALSTRAGGEVISADQY